MVTARKPRTHAKPVSGCRRAAARRPRGKPTDAIDRKIDEIIKRRESALRMLD
jgi:hypothetical protein